MSLFTDLPLASQVQALYVAYYGRPADFDGLVFWQNEIQTKGLPAVINAFGNSAESTALFGGSVVSDTVNKVFNALLGRNADPEGLNFYATEINEGRLSLAEVALAVLDGVQGDDVAIVQNRLAAANNFTDTFNNGTNDAAERAAYAGQDAADAGRAFLAQVTADPATVAAADAAAAVQALVDAGTPGQTFALTTGVDTVNGTVNNDIIDARLANSLDQFDSINGGAGRDAIINVGNLAAGSFVGVTNVEIISAVGNINLGVNAAAAGIDTLNMSKAAGTAADVTGFNAALTVNGSAFADTVTLSLADAGDKSLKLGLGANIVNVNGVAAAPAGSVVMAFESGKVGDGVGTVKIDGVNGDITAGNIGTKFVGNQANQFSVIGTDAAGALVPAQDRGDFQTVVLGTAGADTATTVGEDGNVYINGGAGNDTLTAVAAANARHFLVGGAGDDILNVTTAAAGTVVAIAGGGDDAVTVAAGSLGSEIISLSAGTNTVTYAGMGLNLNAPVAGADRDTLTGGTGRDTLAATSAVLTGVTAAAVAADQSISGFEALTVTDAQNGTMLVTSDIQAGIDTVSLNGTGVAASSVTFDSGVAATLNLGAVAAGQITVVSAGTGQADSVTIANTAAAQAIVPPATVGVATDVFAGQAIAALGVETLTINSNAAGSVNSQDIGNIVLTGTTSGTPATTASTTVKFVGTNAVSATGIAANTVDATGLTGVVGLVASTGASSITGSAGNDALTVTTVTAAEVAEVSTTTGGVTTITTPGVAAINSVVATGAGSDAVNVNTTGDAATSISTGDGVDGVELSVRSTGKLTVDLGAGNDGLNLDTVGAAGILAGDSINGGAGTDTAALTGVALRANGDYVVLNERLQSFEQLVFNGAEGALNADLLNARYTALQFTNASVVTGVTTQALGTTGDLTATAKGYVAGVVPTPTVYAGTLNITSGDVINSASPAFQYNAAAANSVVANAQSLNLTVKANAVNSVATTLTGDLQTATVSLVNSATTAAVPVTTLASVVIDNTAVGALGLDALTSVTLSGNGSATITNANMNALVSVDASGMTGGVTLAGAPLAGLDYTTTNTRAETVTLGASVDDVNIGAAGSQVVLGTGGVITSTDTITGLSLVLDAAGTALAANSDELDVAGFTIAAGMNKFVVAAGVTTLENAVQSAAQSANDSLVFQFQGNTYVFVDNTDDNLSTGDTLVTLTGAIDLDALLVSLA